MGNTSLPNVRVWLNGPMKVEKRTEREDDEEIPPAAWEKVSPHLLLKALFIQSNRRALRPALLHMLWSEPDTRRASGGSTTKAVGQLRRVLTSDKENRLVITERGRVPFYCLAGQERIWVDVDAAFAALHQAEHMGRTSPGALPLLEEAASYFDGERFLREKCGRGYSAKRQPKHRIGVSLARRTRMPGGARTGSDNPSVRFSRKIRAMPMSWFACSDS